MSEFVTELKKYTGNDGDVVVPDYINVIGINAFSYCTSLTSITIPDSVTEIGFSVFYDCPSLNKIKMGKRFSDKSVDWFRGVFKEELFGIIALDNFDCDSKLLKHVLEDKIVLVDSLISKGRIDLISVMLEKSPKISLADLDEMLEHVQKYDNAEINGVLLEYKNKNYSRKQIEKEEADRLDKSLGIKELTVADYKRLFDFEKKGDGIIITGIKKPETVLEIPSAIGGKAVIAIAEDTFSDCTSLTSITIPKSVTEISWISSLLGLKEILVNEENTEFCSIDGVLYSKDKARLVKYPYSKKDASYVIPESVTTIDKEAFFGCTSLASITIPESVTTIGEGAFKGCPSLASITISKSVTAIEQSTFSNCTSLTSVTIPEGVTTIDKAAFKDCTSLTSITIPKSVTEICWNAFFGCTSLTSITIPKSVTEISWISSLLGLKEILVNEENTEFCSIDGVLYSKDKARLVKYPYSKKDASYVIPKSVTTIDEEAFHGCASLASITIPESVTEIDEGAFRLCTSLTSITIPERMITIRECTFEGCTSLTSITIPESVTTIEQSSFSDCTSLTSITIPDSVTTIDEYAFYRCTSLTSIVIPNNVTTIGNSAFFGCTSITSITIPESATTIDEYAFEGCTSLTSVTIPESVTEIGWNAFANCPNLTIYVEAEKEPSDWSSSWNPDKCPVVWGSKRS